MHVLIITYSATGHVRPFIPLAQEMLSQGWDVDWAMILPQNAPLSLKLLQNLQRQGMRLIPVERWDGLLTAPNWKERWASLGASRFAEMSFEVKNGSEVLVSIIDEVKPDIVATEGTIPLAMLAASIREVPVATIQSYLCTVCPEGIECERGGAAHDAFAEKLHERFSKHDLPTPKSRYCVASSDDLETVWCVEELVGDEADKTSSHFLGTPAVVDAPEPEEDAFDWSRLSKNQPVVYAAFGTTYLPSKDVVHALYEGATKLDMQFVIASRCDYELPGSAITVEWAPQRAMLKRVDAFISHGGAASFTESLVAGVPMLVVPLATDQPLQAALAESSGVGIAVHPSDVDREVVTNALGRLVQADGTYRSRARRLADLYGQAGGVGEALRLLEEQA